MPGSEEDTVCYCAGVTRGAIVDAIRAGARTLQDVQLTTGAGIGSRCKDVNPKGVCCHADIRAIIERELGQGAEPACGSCCG